MPPAAWLVGLAVQGRREASALQAQTEQAEQAQRAAIAAERVRIARELHDLIAHNVSVVVVQSVAAQGVLEDQPARAREPLAHIERSGRQALTELRRLLDVVRDQDEPDELREPQPGLAQLATLVDSVRSTGLPVTLQVDGEPPADSAAVGPCSAEPSRQVIVAAAASKSAPTCPSGNRYDHRRARR